MEELEQRMRAFVVEYQRLCDRHGMILQPSWRLLADTGVWAMTLGPVPVAQPSERPPVEGAAAT